MYEEKKNECTMTNSATKNTKFTRSLCEQAFFLNTVQGFVQECLKINITLFNLYQHNLHVNCKYANTTR